jgi:calcium-dependent protein kinase
MFMTLDKDQDGTLTVEEMRSGMEKAGIKDIPKDLLEIMKEVDADGSGVIDYTEFLAATLSRRQYIQEDVVWSAFRVFDLDGNGKITREELAQVLSGELSNVEQAMQMNRDEIERIIKEVDQDGDGEIDFQEFFAMMKKKEQEDEKERREKRKKRDKTSDKKSDDERPANA